MRAIFTGPPAQLPLLTTLDLRNRAKAYSQYLPATFDELQTYWRALYGQDCLSDTRLLAGDTALAELCGPGGGGSRCTVALVQTAEGDRYVPAVAVAR